MLPKYAFAMGYNSFLKMENVCNLEKCNCQKKIPKICLTNILDFPEKSDCLKDLSPIKKQLIMPRLSFMTIRPLGYQGESLLKALLLIYQFLLAIL